MLTEKEQIDLAELEASKKRHPSRNNGQVPRLCGLCWDIAGIPNLAKVYSAKYEKFICAECYEENH